MRFKKPGQSAIKKFKLTITPTMISLEIPKDLTRWLEADLSLHAKKIAELVNSSSNLHGEQKLSDFGSITLYLDNGVRSAIVTTKAGYTISYVKPKGTAQCKPTLTTQSVN